MSNMFNSTHLVVMDDCDVAVRRADNGAVYIELDYSTEQRLTLSGRPEELTTMLLKAAALVIEQAERVTA